MKKTNDFDLSIGIQQTKYNISNNFKYTKFCSIKLGRLFRSNYYQINHLIAAGTINGPIVIYTENYNLLTSVCVLCSHTTAITDIIQMEDNYFVSASTDGTIVKWSNDDCSFISSFINVAEKGEVRLMHYQENPNFILINTLGFPAFLFDLNSGRKIQTFNVYGILNLTYFHPDKCAFIKEPLLGILKFSSFSVYTEPSIQTINNNDLPEPIFRYPTNPLEDDKFFLSEFGLIKSTINKWELLSPANCEKIIEGKVRLKINNDCISNVKWSNQTTFCISTYCSQFVVYFLRINKDNVKFSCRSITVTSPVQNYCQDFLFFSIDFDHKNIKGKPKKENSIKDDESEISTNESGSTELLKREKPNFGSYRIVFAHKSKNVYSLKTDKTYLKNVVNKRPKLYHVPRASSARVVETDGRCAFYVRNWEKGGNPTLKHASQSRITSIASRESQNLKLEIIVGCADGTVSCFSENTKKPFRVHTESVLSTAVIGLAHLPFKYHGRPTLLAVGQDGSAALLKSNRVIMQYANNMEIDAAFCHKIYECIILHRRDQSFIAFNIYEPGPIYMSSILPNDSVQVWSLNEMKNEAGVYNNNYYPDINSINNTRLNIDSDSALSTNLVRFGQNSWFYTSVGISNFLNSTQRRYKLFAKFITQLFKQKSDPLPHSQSITFSMDLNESASRKETDNSEHEDNSNANSSAKKRKIRFANSANNSNDSLSKLSLSTSTASFLDPNSAMQSSGYIFPKSNSIQSIVDWISPEKPSIKLDRPLNLYRKIIENLSLVIIGENKKSATFFYPQYRICGNMGFILSDQNSSKNIIIKSLISGEATIKGDPMLIPCFTQLLSCGNSKIELAAADQCNRLINFVDNRAAMNLISSIDEGKMNSQSNMFVSSIVAFLYPNLVNQRNYQQLLSFLINKTKSNQGSSYLSLSILIRGFYFWLNVMQNTNLFIKTIDCFIKFDRKLQRQHLDLNSIEDILLSIALNNLNSFFEAAKKIMNSYSERLNLLLPPDTCDEYKIAIKNLIDLLSKVAFSDPKRCGVNVSLMLVDFAASSDRIAPWVAVELQKHSTTFSYVSIADDFVAIGDQKGVVSVFKNYNIFFSDKFFNSPVDYVSIGPRSLFCVAISVNERSFTIFPLSASNRTNGIKSNLEKVGNHYQIFWSDPTHCNFKVID